MQEPVKGKPRKGRARRLGKSLNEHIETTDMQTQEYYVFTICNNVVQYDMMLNEGARIYGAQ